MRKIKIATPVTDRDKEFEKLSAIAKEKELIFE